MDFHAWGSYETTLKDTTLIIPIVSTANLPQLAVDLLISSLQLETVGILDSHFLHPVVGGREDGQDGVTTPLEVYGRQGFPFHLIQQRSPVIKSRKRECVDALFKFITNSGFSAVLILSGLDLSNRVDAHMYTPAYHLIPTQISPASIASSPLSLITSTIPPFSTSSTTEPVLPSSGITPLILKSLPSTQFPPTALILQYVLEGDNREDASLLATIVARVIGSQPFAWKEPESWMQGLFGTPHDQTLFG
ncbi:hypothetical protein BS47DRAFT_1353020 [Hydnum rufescens UP504]|uniref:Proteasome assembly chaperone 2 n=1 Tax=Hydnum rufescens UP504 TaxID=1448309 RepID=A0A9P6AI68_9AGAM|nr:hypothetical protein BS47DRAFT_1353020 [Hydnum rufescens UP504]